MAQNEDIVVLVRRGCWVQWQKFRGTWLTPPTLPLKHSTKQNVMWKVLTALELFFFNLANINRMSPNQSSSKDLRQNSKCTEGKTTVHLCVHSPVLQSLIPPTNPNFFCGYREVSHPFIILDPVYRAFKAVLTLLPAPRLPYNNFFLLRFLETCCIWRRKKMLVWQ